MRQRVIQEKKDEDGEKYLTVDSEDDWHLAWGCLGNMGE